MMDSSMDLRMKNKLEKQDEIEVSDGEEEGVATPSRDSRQSRSGKKQTSPAAVSHAKSADKLTKQSSAPAHSERPMLASHVVKKTETERKTSMPVAHVDMPDVPDTVSMHQQHMRNELTAPRHLGSLAFSSMSTEESSIADVDGLGRQMGMLSVQGSIQDETYGGERKKSFEDWADFLVATWHRQPKDRANILNFERILEEMFRMKDETKYVSPPLNSYYRMLFHRMADVWGFEHSVESVKNEQAVSVGVRLLPDSRRPDQLFRDMIDPTIPEETPSNFLILKRPKNHSTSETSHAAPSRVTTAKSLEERQANYDRVRQQIFGQESDAGNDGDVTPQPYGLPHNYEAGSDAQAAYHRSRSALSDVSSDANYELQQQPAQMRPVYGDPYGQAMVRPLMQQPVSMYSVPYGYAGGVMGYQTPDGAYVDPLLYQQMQQYLAQQHYYQQLAVQQQQYHPQQGQMYGGMHFAQQGYPNQGYNQQGSFDQIQYDPSSQYGYQQVPPHLAQQQYNPGNGEQSTGGMATSHGYALPPGTDPSARQQQQTPAQGYTSPAGGSPQALRAMGQRGAVGAPGGAGGAVLHQSTGGAVGAVIHQADYTEQQPAPTPANSFIIPLRFPPMGQSSQLGMYLKLPCARPHGGEGGGAAHLRRVSRHNSGRSSVDRQNSGPSPGGVSGGSGKQGDYAVVQGGEEDGCHAHGRSGAGKERCEN